MNYLGDFAEDATINLYFTTSDGSGGAVAPSSAFEAADIVIYKDDSATQKTSTNGITMTSPFDSTTGLHQVVIDTSVDTGDSGFWAAGSDYTVVLAPDETVDSQTVVKVLAQFSIENRYNPTPPTAAAIADAVWDEATSGHAAAGTTGKALSDIPSSVTSTILADTTVGGVALSTVFVDMASMLAGELSGHDLDNPGTVTIERYRNPGTSQLAITYDTSQNRTAINHSP